MAFACAASATTAAPFPGLADYLACNADTLGETGFKTMAGGVLLPGLLTGCLVIYIALIGYRLVLGQPFGARETVLATVRVGLVIAFSTQWPSFETVIYRVVMDGPAEVAAGVLQPLGLPLLGAPQAAARLQAAYDTLRASSGQKLSTLAAGSNAQASTFPQNGGGVNGPSEQPMMSLAGALLTGSAVGGALALRMAAGFLLAIGPLLITLALFDSMAGLFIGWVRALFAAAIGAGGLAILIALQVSFVEALALGAQVGDGHPVDIEGLLIVGAVFAATTGAMLLGSAVVAVGFRAPRWHGLAGWSTMPTAATASSEALVMQPAAIIESQSQRSRAQSVAEAAISLGRRERALLGAEGEHAPGVVQSRNAGFTLARTTTNPDLVGGGQPAGYALRRPVRRASVSFTRRDGR